MPIVEVERNGQVYEIDVPEGQDVGQAVASFNPAPQATTPLGDVAPVDTLPSLDDASAPIAPRPEKGLGESLMDRLGVVGDFAKGTMRDITGANTVPGERNLAEQAQRGVGLAGRTITGAIPKTAAGITDLGSMLLNAGVTGIDELGQLIGDEPIDYRFPTDNVANTDALLSEVFPEPETFGERAVGLGGEALTTGGLGAAALASRAPNISRTVPSIADEIGTFFAQNPKRAAAAEFGGGAGTQMAGELAEDADVGPVGRLVASIAGGIGGSLAPSASIGGAQRLAAGARQAVEPLTTAGVETRAARALQERAGDPQEAARLAREAPDDIMPARASEDPNLRATEAKVLEDNPQLADEVAQRLQRAETQTVDELAGDLPEGVNRAEWQQQVVQRAAPEGTTIAAGQPDEMLDDAFRAFEGAYQVARGYPVRNEVMQIEGGNVPMPERIVDAVGDPAVLTGDNVRQRVGRWLEGRYEDTVRRGDRVGGPDDAPLVEVQSEDLLELRQIVRQEQRRQRSAGRTNPDSAATADILKGAERAITDVLESQLPENVSTALRNTDMRYSDFKKVEDAIFRSGEKGLTPEALRQSVKQTTGSRGRVARGDTGELGDLAERGADVTRFMNKGGRQDGEIERVFRTMDDATANAARADITRDIVRKASPAGPDGLPRLNGKALVKRLEDNRSSLQAAGFNEGDINRMERLGRRLVTIQSPSPRAAKVLIDDNLGALSGLLSRVAGAKFARRVVSATGTGGPGVLSLTGFAARQFEKLFSNLSVNGAEDLITEAMTNRELFDSLMTRSTASPVQQAKANRTIKAWLAQSGSTDNGEE